MEKCDKEVYEDNDCKVIKETCDVKDVYYQDDMVKCSNTFNCCDIINLYDRSNKYCIR